MSRVCFLIAMGMVFLAACDDEYDLKAFSIGDEFIQSGTSVAIVDSYAVRMSTVLIDSVATSGTGILFAGSYVDDQFGKISAKSYFQVGLPSSQSISDQEYFDSLILVIKRKDLFYGDTLKQQTLNVYRLLEDIELNDDDNLYNTSSFNYTDIPVGSKTFKPWLENDQVEIKISDEIGVDFFEKMKNSADEFESEDEFLEYFKGFVIGSGTEDGAILSYDTETDTVKLVMHTHLVTNVVTEKSYKFEMINIENQFNQISADRIGTFLENLNNRYVDLPSEETGNKSFMQAGIGCMPRLEFPGLQSLLEGTENYLLVRAELILRPVPFSYKKVSLPSELVLYESDKYNRITSEITDANDGTLTATLYTDEVYNEETYYVFDVTDFITDELSDAYFEVDHGLLVGLPNASMGSSIDRVVFDNRQNTMFKPQLKLYYIYYN